MNHPLGTLLLLLDLRIQDVINVLGFLERLTAIHVKYNHESHSTAGEGVVRTDASELGWIFGRHLLRPGGGVPVLVPGVKGVKRDRALLRGCVILLHGLLRLPHTHHGLAAGGEMVDPTPLLLAQAKRHLPVGCDLRVRDSNAAVTLLKRMKMRSTWDPDGVLWVPKLLGWRHLNPVVVDYLHHRSCGGLPAQRGLGVQPAEPSVQPVDFPPSHRHKIMHLSSSPLPMSITPLRPVGVLDF
mmetsp:Transcript_42800/g.97530  ORF Transcript_42800/g.97530 Transcript_42800/m.97530 type:complete len:241 (-) Transcript_42800:245-967(-)